MVGCPLFVRLLILCSRFQPATNFSCRDAFHSRAADSRMVFLVTFGTHYDHNALLLPLLERGWSLALQLSIQPNADVAALNQAATSCVRPLDESARVMAVLLAAHLMSPAGPCPMVHARNMTSHTKVTKSHTHERVAVRCRALGACLGAVEGWPARLGAFSETQHPTQPLLGFCAFFAIFKRTVLHLAWLLHSAKDLGNNN